MPERHLVAWTTWVNQVCKDLFEQGNKILENLCNHIVQFNMFCGIMRIQTKRRRKASILGCKLLMYDKMETFPDLSTKKLVGSHWYKLEMSFEPSSRIFICSGGNTFFFFFFFGLLNLILSKKNIPLHHQ
jgi:hypothetical protein